MITLSACDDTSVKKEDDVVDTQENQTQDDNKTIEDENTNEDIYMKDGDIPKYFRTFGEYQEVDSSSDWSEQDSYVITHTFGDGMTVKMVFFDVDNAYNEFQFVATKGDETLVFDVDIDVQLTPRVKYSQPGKVVQGWMNFNGLDQDPVFALNTNWEYTVFDESDIPFMETMMNSFVLNINNYYNENIGADIVQPTSN